MPTPDQVDQYEFEIRINSCLIGLCSLTVLFFTYIIFKVGKVMKCLDPIFFAMLCLLETTLLLNILFFSYHIKLCQNSIDGIQKFDHAYYCQENMYSSLPALFLALGTILNINKWTYFGLRNRAFRDANEDLQQTRSDLRQKVFGLNLITLSVCIVVVTTYCIYYVR